MYLFASYGSNVQSGNASIGTPELIKAGRYGSLLAKKYGLACRSGGGLSGAKRCNCPSWYRNCNVLNA